MKTATKSQMIRRLTEKLKSHYIFPDVAERISSHLQERFSEGAFDDITEGKIFALALTIEMQEVSQDEHLWVRWHAQRLPDTDTSLREDQGWQDEQRLVAELDNHGFYKVERLPGNVGYVDIRYFHRPEWGAGVAVAAMNFLENTSGLIFDLRKCTGGYPGMVVLVSSYLFAEEPIHLSSIYWRDEDRTQQYWTHPYIMGKRFVDEPVYILISRTTFSAGEGFAYDLQAQQRAIIVGEKTDGGAHPGASYRLSPHYEVFIPGGRAINPITNQNWEKSGVVPDIAVPQEHAFVSAYYFSLQSIVGNKAKSPFYMIEEAQSALNELSKDQKICPACAYQNPLYREKCKNCDQTLTDRSPIR